MPVFRRPLLRPRPFFEAFFQEKQDSVCELFGNKERNKTQNA